MGETEDRKRDARPDEDEVQAEKVSELEAEREERNRRLGIGNHTEDGPQSQSAVGGNLPSEIQTENGVQQETPASRE